VTIFPAWHLALTAVVASIASFAVLRWRYRSLEAREAAGLAMIVGISVLAWRAACNVPLLNDDPIPPFSPNDVMTPIATYVLLNVYGAFRELSAGPNRARVIGWLVAVSFAVNVAVI